MSKKDLIETKEHNKRRKELKKRRESNLETDKAIVKGALESKYSSKEHPMKKERVLEGFAPGKSFKSDYKRMQGLKKGGRAGYKVGKSVKKMGCAIKGKSPILR